MNRRMEFEEREINLLHLLCYMLEKYKSLVIVLVIGAVLGLGVGMIIKPEPVVQEEKESTIVEEEYEPTDEMKQSMEIAYQYRQLFEQQKEYNDNSILMKMDSNLVYEGRAAYYLSNSGDDGELAELYYTVIEDREFLKKLEKVANVEAKYIREIIGASYSRSSYNQEKDVAAGVITYKVTHYDEEICKKILECIKKQVEEFHQQHSGKNNPYVFREVRDILIEMTNNSYLDRENNCITKLNNFYNTVVSHEGKFTGKDLVYYQIHYMNETAAIDEEQSITTQVEENEMIRFLFGGMLVAVLFWGMFWGVKYLFDDKIQTKEEIERCYRIPVIGHLGDCNEKKSFYSRIKKYTYDSKEYLEYTLNSLSKNGIVVCGYKETETSDNMGYYYANYLWRDSEAMKMAKEIGSVVIGIELNKSTYGEIEREIEMCLVQNINVLGLIIVE